MITWEKDISSKFYNKMLGMCLIYYEYSTLPRGISINIAFKVGIFPRPKAEVNIYYQGCNIIDIPQGRVEYLFIT